MGQRIRILIYICTFFLLLTSCAVKNVNPDTSLTFVDDRISPSDLPNDIISTSSLFGSETTENTEVVATTQEITEPPTEISMETFAETTEASTDYTRENTTEYSNEFTLDHSEISESNVVLTSYASTEVYLVGLEIIDRHPEKQRKVGYTLKATDFYVYRLYSDGSRKILNGWSASPMTLSQVENEITFSWKEYQESILIYAYDPNHKESEANSAENNQTVELEIIYRTVGRTHYVGETLTAQDFYVYRRYPDGSRRITNGWSASSLYLASEINEITFSWNGLIQTYTVYAKQTANTQKPEETKAEETKPEETKPEETKQEETQPVSEKLKTIICVGDSLTEGAGGMGVTYVQELEDLLQENHYNYQALNRGGGAEQCNSILARYGGTPIYVEAFTLPADNEEVVPINLYGQDNLEKLNFSVKLWGMNPCYIAGIPCELTAEYDPDGNHYFIRRLEPGEETLIAKGMRLYPNSSLAELYADLYICWIGTNNRSGTKNAILYYQKLFVNRIKTSKVLIVGLCCPKTEKINHYCAKYWGDRYLDLKTEIIKNIDKYDIELTDADRQMLAKGEIPPALMHDEVHFNADGYRIIADIIYQKLQKLQWLE